MAKKSVLVAMSGGVDSSVAAYLLKKEGFKVAGVTMCFGVKDTGGKKASCCGPTAIEDAKKVSLKLDIPHYTTDFSKHLEEKVIDKFISGYVSGKTPNPCVDCNKSLKFDTLLKKALSLDFEFLATGHYAKIERKDKNFFLKKGKDPKKDQSYFLYAIEKAVLKSILFPVGDLTKDEVRNIAKKARLPVAGKTESQDICFIPERKYHRFLSERTNGQKRGPIMTLEGEILGEHKGAAFYTIGQRGGLGVGYRHPLYVVSTDTKKNSLTVGKKEDLYSRGLIAGSVNLLVKDLPQKASAKIRYNQSEAKCEVFPGQDKDKIKVIFKELQEAVTPGQSVVLYDNDTILAGGIIEEAIRR